MLNKSVIMGRLTADPVLRQTPGGSSVVNFTIACERDFKGQDGNKETDFIECVAWRNTADFVNKYFSKGRMAVVEGRLQVRSWTDNEGAKRKTVEIVAENVYFGDSKQAAANIPAVQDPIDELPDTFDLDDDCPF